MLEALGIQKNEALYVKKKDTGALIHHIHKTKTAKKGPVSIIIMEITKTSIRFWSFSKVLVQKSLLFSLGD